ncbi:MAG TPA: efflux RND transporter periplasmic adaptor subunit [Candidatus Aphodousia faecipullorum]|nr:efflux RND transporter periplasmic adaptor subunit [Candidatus Aphodousia faecipullorum]
MKLTTVGLACALFLLSGCSDRRQTVERPPLQVGTIVATPISTYRWAETFGQTEGVEEVEVRSQVGGVLRALHFKEGEWVKAGDTLFEIEKEPYEAALIQAQAQAKQAQANLVKAQRDYRRASELIKVNAISRQEFDDAKTSLDVAASELALAKAQQTNAQINLEHALVPAPVDGIAGKSEVNVGSLVSAETTLLTSITQPDTLRVAFSVSDSSLAGATLTKDNIVQVYVPGAKTPLIARLDYIGRQIDADRGTLRLRAVLPKTDQLLPGQYVEVRLMLGRLEKVFSLPQGVIRQRPDGTYSVYVLQDGLAREREVTLAHWEGSNWIVTSGLKPGEEVISNQILRLRDKLKVVKANAQGVDSQADAKTPDTTQNAQPKA